MCLNFEAEIAKKGPAYRNLYSIHFITSDKTLFPYDAKFSLKLKSLLNERNIELTEGAELENIDDFNRRIKLESNSHTVTKTYDAVFVDPAVEKSHLFDFKESKTLESLKDCDQELLLFLGNQSFYKLAIDGKGLLTSAKRSNFLDKLSLRRRLAIRKSLADYP
jgi:hypothetical protein